MTCPKWRLESPHTFYERVLLFGGGGTGKSTAAIRVAEAIPTAEMYVIDNDISSAYDRLLSEYPHVENVSVHEIMPGWEDFIDTVKSIVKTHNCPPGTPIHERPWLVVDSVTPSWEDVQAFYIDQVMGTDLGEAMIQLRKNSKTQKEYMASLAEMMQWPTINKIYAQFYLALKQWKGNFLLTAEAASVSKQDKEDIIDTFGYLGVKPKGQGRLHYIAASNLYLNVSNKDTWRMTAACKDRSRIKVERQVFENFAEDYLIDVAGWNRVPR